MTSHAFIVLYTHQKTKKSKTWQDGILKLSSEGRVATLYNDKGQRLENVYLKTNKLNLGDDLESDRYLITVEGEDLSGGVPQSATEVKEVPKINKTTLKPIGLLHPVGLKRKYSGFQGPREVSKKPSLEVEDITKTSSPVLAQTCSSLPSQLYTTSPLFATPRLKNAETIVPVDSGSLVSWKNNPDKINHNVPFSSSFSCSYSCNSTWITESEKVDDSSSAASNIEVNSSAQNIRSRSQILALLKPQPPQQTRATFSKSNKQHYNKHAGSKQSDVLNTKDATLNEKENNFVVAGQKPKYPQGMIPIEPNFIKSRWDVYLEHSSPSDSEDPVNTDKDKSVEPVDPNRMQCFSSSLDNFLNQNSNLKSSGENILDSDEAYMVMDNNVQSSLLSLQLSAQPSVKCVSSVGIESEKCQLPPLPEGTEFSTCPETSILHLQWKTETSNCERFVGQESILNSDNHPYATPPFGDTSSKYSHHGCSYRETTISEKPVASPVLNIPDTNICSAEEDISDTAMTEITFNLMDSFDSIVSDDEDSNILTEGCLHIKEVIAEKGLTNHKGQKDNMPLHCQNGKHTVNEIMPSKDIAGLSVDSDISGIKDYCLVEQDSNLQVLSNTVEHDEGFAMKEEHKEKFPGTSDLGCTFDIKTELSQDKKHPTENTMHISMGNIVQLNSSLLENCTVVKEVSKLSQESNRSSNNCILESPINKSQFRMPLLENHMHNSNEDILCNESTSDNIENNNAENSISVLKRLTKHNNAIESLDILKDDSESTSQEDECSGQTDKLNGEVEEYICSPDIHSNNTSSFQCPEPAPLKMLCTVSAEEKCHVELSEDFPAKPDSMHVPQGTHCNNPARDRAFPLLQWGRSTQESDCDWDLSQWPSRGTIKPNLTILQEKLDVDRPIFLRPRYENVTMQLKDTQTATQDTSFPNITVSQVGSRLQRQLPVVTTPDLVDSTRPVPAGHEYKEFILDNNLSLPPNISSAMNNFIDDLVHDVECTREDTGFLKTTEDRSGNSPNRSSKWTKYQNKSHSSKANENVQDIKANEEFFAQSLFRKEPCILEKGGTGDKAPVESAHLSLLKGTLSKNNSSFLQRGLLTKRRPNIISTQHNEGNPNFLSDSSGNTKISCELHFPSRETVQSAVSIPKREISIPILFQSATHYKHVFTAALTEHLNVIMFELSQRLHKALSKVDMSSYTSSRAAGEMGKHDVAPLCIHQQPAKLVMVKKEGPNKGRLFYTCDAPKSDQCKFFKWLNETQSLSPVEGKAQPKVAMGDLKSVASYVRCHKVALYEESYLMVRKVSGFQNKSFGKFKKMNLADSDFAGESKTKLYLKLNRKENSSTYSKDDLWIVSKMIDFEPVDTFIACSVFFGPSANNEIEVFPLKGYCPSNWPSNTLVHAVLVCNASSELTSLRNLQEHFNPSTLPIMPDLLKMQSKEEGKSMMNTGKFKPPSRIAKVFNRCELPSSNFILAKAQEMIEQFCLNEDQATALMQIAQMMTSAEGSHNAEAPPITVIHGVFGAGKSYLLSVVVLFLVQLFEQANAAEVYEATPWKLLISSSTNVAVDRVLLGLLDLGFNQFIRVGSIRKIAKPILPYSLHAGSENESEQLKELLALLKDNLTPVEKAYVRKSIEQHKLGTNKILLGQVRVVGATCASCPFACLSNLKFPVVVLDECSQMTEPTSMLPVARFQCEKLILVGDPKQLSPTIQGSEPAHKKGLEQTLHSRLCLMGHKAIMLRTQYRCHPAICSIANELFYDSHLINGVSEEDRKPLLDWLPTLCFYNVNGTEQVEGNNSFYNMEEANFTVKLIQSLIASGIEGSMIGVITLYKSQMYKIFNSLASNTHYDSTDIKAVQVSTVDAFQGAEKEIIILSCVRTRQVGFIDSEKRMNVALTRGKRHLLIIANLACLRKNKLWEHVIHHCERQQNGLKHVSQWEETLNAILMRYQEKKLEEDINMKKKKSKTMEGNVNPSPLS
ncbi:protein ZGRF1 isoform X2 [Xenopus laevis]|uniref:5'-3' DNA helicase ZGRF1 n=1 Tax=Xenopus laevis TaxID=8355 RepID=A0A8J0UMY1_XENLA|nr:protein ZGRF1 isoform X2 [Xenopus laevis]